MVPTKRVVIKMNLGGKYVFVRGYVMPEYKGTALIGTGTLKRMGAIISLEQEKVWFQNIGITIPVQLAKTASAAVEVPVGADGASSSKEEQSTTLRAMEEVRIPPFHETLIDVEARGSSLNRHNAMITPAPMAKAAVAFGVGHILNGSSVVQVANLNKEAIIIAKGEVLAIAGGQVDTPVEEVSSLEEPCVLSATTSGEEKEQSPFRIAKNKDPPEALGRQ